MGRGIHVKLRLRRPNRDGDFFPFNQVLDTMLHELCHNLISPHNANFYKLWDELRKVLRLCIFLNDFVIKISENDIKNDIHVNNLCLIVSVPFTFVFLV